LLGGVALEARVERAIGGSSESLAGRGGTLRVGEVSRSKRGEHWCGGVVAQGNLGLGLDVHGHGIWAGYVHNLLHVDGLVLDHIYVLDNLAGHVHVLDHLDLNGGVNVLDDINVLVDDLGLVDGIGAIDVDDLNLWHVADLFDLNNLGHVLDDLKGGIYVGGNWNVADFLACLCHNLGNMTDDLVFSCLGHDLRYVANDLLDLRDLNVFDGYGYVYGYGGLDMLDLWHGDLDLTDLGYSLHDGNLHLLFDELGHVDGAVHNDLTRDVTDLSDFNLDGAGDLAVLNDFNRDVFVDDLVLGHLNNSLHGDGASDLLGDLHILHDGLDLNLGDLNDSLNGFLNVLNLRDLHNALLCHDLGNVDNALLGDDLGLDHVYGGMSNGGKARHQHWVGKLHGSSQGLVVCGHGSSRSEHIIKV